MWMRKAMRQVELVEADLAPDTLAEDLLDRSANTVTGMLSRFRADAADLEAEIADRAERLCQTRVAIAAFESAGAIIDGGKLSPIAADPDKVGRLVPRLRGTARELAEAAQPVVDKPTVVMVHKDIRA